MSVFAHSKFVLCVDKFSLTRCSLSHVSLQCSIFLLLTHDILIARERVYDNKNRRDRDSHYQAHQKIICKFSPVL